eukprot:NODE_657_length_4970_cov_0.583453.p1 type:complete len:394 gc:universal NODE_657_length_4970_cov_0.583453:4351-3170(-)
MSSSLPTSDAFPLESDDDWLSESEASISSEEGYEEMMEQCEEDIWLDFSSLTDILSYVRDFEGCIEPNTPAIASELGLESDADGFPDLQAVTPSEIFSLFFKSEFFDSIAVQTSIYCHQKKAKRAADNNIPVSTSDIPNGIDGNKIKTFLGLALLLMHRKRANVDNHWTTSFPFGDDYVKKVMTKNDFKFFMQNLHLTNNEQSDSTDKLFKLKPILEKESLLRLFVVAPNALSLDEAIIPWTGRDSKTFTIKTKPQPRGFKVFTLCCPRTGYPFAFYFDDKSDSDAGKVIRIVSKMTEFLEDSSVCLFCDNWFTTRELMNTLLERGIYYCGTIRTNRIPDHILQELQGDSFYQSLYIQDVNQVLLRMIKLQTGAVHFYLFRSKMCTLPLPIPF